MTDHFRVSDAIYELLGILATIGTLKYFRAMANLGDIKPIDTFQLNVYYFVFLLLIILSVY